MDKNKIAVAGHKGYWHVIGTAEIEEVVYHLLEHNTWGEDAASLIIDDAGVLILEDVYNGFDDLREHLESLIEAIGKEFKMQEAVVYPMTQEWEELKSEYFDWIEDTEHPLNMTQWAMEYKGITIRRRGKM